MSLPEERILFEVHSHFQFVHLPENRALQVNAPPVLSDSSILPQPSHSSLEDKEDATPAPAEVPALPFLRVTIDHTPKEPAVGYVFGRSREACDIFLGDNQEISRRQFALHVVVHYGECSLMLKSLSRHGTTIRSAALGNKQVKTQRAISPNEHEMAVEIGSFQFRLVFPVRGTHRTGLGPELCMAESGPHSNRTCDASLDRNKLQIAPPPTTKPSWMQDYHLVRKIGHGGFSVVYRVNHIVTGHVYAVKEIRAPDESAGGNEMHLPNLRELNCEHLTRIFHIYHEHPAIVMELVGSNLGETHKRDPLGVHEIRQVVTQVALGLECLHGAKITHRDLKPANVLVSSRWPIRVKLADFGLACAKITAMTSFCGTQKYVAPEVVQRSRPPSEQADDSKYEDYDNKCDIWSLGVLTLDLCCGLPRWGSNDWNTWPVTIVEHAKKFSAGEMTPLLLYMLQIEPFYRPCARGVLVHKTIRDDWWPYFLRNAKSSENITDFERRTPIPDTEYWSNIPFTSATPCAKQGSCLKSCDAPNRTMALPSSKVVPFNEIEDLENRDPELHGDPSGTEGIKEFGSWAAILQLSISQHATYSDIKKLGSETS